MKNRKTRGLGKKTIEKTEALKREMAEFILKEKEPDSNIVCKCSKSKCLQMYCLCFTKGFFCDSRCTCHGCCNTMEHEGQIRMARRNIKYRDSLAFKSRIVKEQKPMIKIKLQQDIEPQKLKEHTSNQNVLNL